MKLLVNISNNIGGGGLQVALSFVNECRAFSENEYHIAMSDAVVSQIDTTSYPSNFHFYRTYSNRFWKLSGVMSCIECRVRPDVVFTVFGPSYWRPKAPHVMGFANGYYLYPESPFWSVTSLPHIWKVKLKKRLHKFFINRDADAIVCETVDATKRSAKLFDSRKKYFTVSNSCNSIYFSPDKQVDITKLPDHKQDEFRFMTLSKYYPHKNFEQIPLIIENLFLRKIFSIKFAVTLDEENYKRIFGKDYEDIVYNVGFTPVAECPALYRECDAVFLPTMLECFSAGYLEAMAMQKPILTSDLSFARTICRDAAMYVDPLEIEQITDKIIEMATNKSLRTELVERGNNRLKEIPTAYERAESYLEICKTVANV